MIERPAFHPSFGYRLATAAGLCLLLASPQASAGAAVSRPVVLALDTATTVNGVQLACTGIGQTRDDARWQSYPVRVEFSNARNEYLVGGAVTVRDAVGRELLSASCDAPWILLRLPKGAYRVEGRILGSAARPRSAPIVSPTGSQLRVVLQFPDA